MCGVDQQYWKKRYKGFWKAGNKREALFKDIIKNWGYTAVKFGFEALSEEYNPDSPDEKGKPDFYISINKHKIYFEVTGTDSKAVSENDPVWIRPDKVAYVKRHGITAFLVHILANQKLVRVINMKNIDESKITHPGIRGTKETYIAIDPSELIQIDEFKKLLDSGLF